MAEKEYGSTTDGAGRLPVLRDVDLSRTTLYLLVVATTLVLVGAPLVFFIWGSVWTKAPGLGGAFTLAGYESLARPIVWETVQNTVVLAIVGTLTAVVLGVLGLVIAVKTDVPGRQLIPFLFIGQYLLPSYIIALAWEFYAKVINGLLLTLPVFSSEVLDVHTIWMIGLISGLHYTGIIYLLASGAMKMVSKPIEEMGALSGAPTAGILNRITLPLILPSLLVATVLVFNRMIQSFGIPIILGPQNNIFVLSTLMFFSLSSYPRNFAFAAALGTVLLIGLLVLLSIQRNVTGTRGKYETVTGTGESREVRLFQLGQSGRLGAQAFIVAVVLLMAVPLLIMVVFSFQPSFSTFSLTEEYTLKNYRLLFVGYLSGSFYQSLFNTFLLAGVGAFLGMVLSTSASYIITKSDSVMGDFLDFLSFVPAGIPGIVAGTAFLWIYVAHLDWLLGTVWGIMIPLIAIFLVYGTRASNSSMRSIGMELEEAALIGGAGLGSILRRIYMPLVKAGFAAGYIILFIDFMKVITIPLLVVGPNNPVLSTLLWQLIADGNIQSAASLGNIMLLIISVIYAVVFLFTDIDVTSL